MLFAGVCLEREDEGLGNVGWIGLRRKACGSRGGWNTTYDGGVAVFKADVEEAEVGVYVDFGGHDCRCF